MNGAEKKLILERPKLAQALVGKEMRLVQDLRLARELQEIKVWQVAAKLGWSQQKVLDIESWDRDSKSSDVRKYLLAINCYIEFTVKPEKALG